MMSDKKPHILLVNDDGISAPGLRVLHESLKDLARLTVVAPSGQRSGAGLSISMHLPLQMDPVTLFGETPAYSLSGTPGDCVKIALHKILPEYPDFVFSGINRGTNAGRNVFYSGTVGGAIEATLHGIPSVALSITDPRFPRFEAAGQFAPALLEYVRTHGLPPGTLLNVNVPTEADVLIKGLKLAKQGRSIWTSNLDERLHPEGFPYFWLGGYHRQFDEDPESDIALIAQGFAAAVPVRVEDLTHPDFAKQKQEFEQFIADTTSRSQV